MENRKVINVSFPRSGHHLLVNLLLKYFSKNIDYQNTEDIKKQTQFKEVIPAGEFIYCPFYKHCQMTPCSDRRTNFQKNHDFGLKLNKESSYKYIVQYRHPLECLVSWYKLKAYQKEDSLETWIEFIGAHHGTRNHDKLTLREFSKKLNIRCFRLLGLEMPTKLNYWKSFVHKWIINRGDIDVYYLPFNELINDPLKKMREVIRFINLKEPYDEELLHKIVERQNIGFRSNIKNFKYYDPKYFKELESKIQKELLKIGLMRIFL